MRPAPPSDNKKEHTEYTVYLLFSKLPSVLFSSFLVLFFKFVFICLFLFVCFFLLFFFRLVFMSLVFCLLLSFLSVAFFAFSVFFFLMLFVCLFVFVSFFPECHDECRSILAQSMSLFQ